MSSTAALMFDAWIMRGGQLEIRLGNGGSSSIPNAGIVNYDPNSILNAYYVTKTGGVAADGIVSNLAHELVHALTGRLDNFSSTDFAGSTVNSTNDIYSELGIQQQLSYIAYGSDSVLDSAFNYTKGQSVSYALTDCGKSYTSVTGYSIDSVNTDWSSRSDSIFLIGSSNANEYHGGSGGDFIYGEGGVDRSIVGGDDNLSGGAGGDLVYGGAGADVLHGDAGNDNLIGGKDSDSFDGGDGTDTASYADSAEGVILDFTARIGAANPAAVAVGLQTAGADTDATGDSMSGIERAEGSDFADTFKSDGTGMHFVGGDGDDKFYLKAGDTAEGGLGADEFYFSSTVLTEEQYGDLSDQQKTFYYGKDTVEVTFGEYGAEYGDRALYYIPIAALEDLDSEDRIYVDGKLLAGETVSVELENSSYYGDISDTSEQYSWLEGSAYNHGGVGFSGIEDYSFFEYDDTTNQYVAAQSGYISLLHGTGYNYPLGYQPVGYLNEVDSGLLINILDLSSDAGGIKVDYTALGRWDPSPWTMSSLYGVTFNDGTLVPTEYMFG